MTKKLCVLQIKNSLLSLGFPSIHSSCLLRRNLDTLSFLANVARYQRSYLVQALRNAGF